MPMQRRQHTLVPLQSLGRFLAGVVGAAIEPTESRQVGLDLPVGVDLPDELAEFAYAFVGHVSSSAQLRQSAPGLRYCRHVDSPSSTASALR